MKSVKHILLAIFIGVFSTAGLVACSSNVAQPAQMVDNSTLTTKVNNALENTPSLNASNISVSTNQGVVQLTGSADSAAQSQLAQQTVQGVYGVQRVNNNLMVKNP